MNEPEKHDDDVVVDDEVDYAARTAAGAALLDLRGATDWREKVDPFRLSQFSVWDCVLAQLYGGYRSGLKALFDDDDVWYTSDVAVRHGFALADDEYRALGDTGYASLTEAWRSELARPRVPVV